MPRSSTLQNKQGTLLLAVILAAPAFAFADNIPAHSKGGSKYVSLSEGFTGQQELQDSSARCSFLFSSPKENGVQTPSISGATFSDIAKGDGGANLGALAGAGTGSDSRPGTGGDFGGNGGTSSGGDQGKGRGKHNGGNGDGAGSGVGSGDPAPVASVAEPGSRTLLLFGLAGFGMIFYRRRMLMIAI
jgi:hypothetical protein